eukprot:304178-Amphidinium_carterae.1
MSGIVQTVGPNRFGWFGWSNACLFAQLFLSEFVCSHFCVIIVMADETEYADGEHTPEVALRHLFVNAKVPTRIRRLFADKGVLTIDHVAAMADNLDGFKSVVRTLFSDDEFGAH